MLRSRGLRVEVDGSSNRMQYKIRTAQEQKVPYMVVLGDREIEARTASPRTRAGEQQEAAGLGRVRRPPGGGVEGADDRVARSAYIRRMQGSSGSVSRPLILVDVAIKVATVGLLAWAILNPDLPQFSGKAFTARALVYPIGLVVLPIGWWLFGRSRMAFPVVADILLGLPFLIDVAGNALDLYDTIEWWDDANHLVNWALHTAAIALLLRVGPWGYRHAGRPGVRLGGDARPCSGSSRST